jgi:hypothetical protein
MGLAAFSPSFFQTAKLLAQRAITQPAPGRVLENSLWRQKTLACVRILHFGSGRKTSNVDVTAVRRERTGDQTLFSGHGDSIWEIVVSVYLRSDCFGYSDVVPIGRRRGRRRCWRNVCVRSIWSIARWSLNVLLTTIPAWLRRSRFLRRTCKRLAYCAKNLVKRARLCHVTNSK